MFCKAGCTPSDPTTDRVKIDMSAVAEEGVEVEHFDMGCGRVIEQYGSKRLVVVGAQSKAEADELVARWQRERPLSEEKRRAQEEEERVQLALKLAEEEQQEAERLRQEEERLRREREEQARLQREAAERRAREEERLRKEELGLFYRRHGFLDAHSPKQAGCAVWGAATTYPLHVAAELAEDRTVGLLLKEGVDTAQKNGMGKTAAQVAQKKNKGGSHDAVLRLLAGAAASPAKPRSGGA